MYCDSEIEHAREAGAGATSVSRQVRFATCLIDQPTNARARGESFVDGRAAICKPAKPKPLDGWCGTLAAAMRIGVAISAPRPSPPPPFAE